MDDNILYMSQQEYINYKLQQYNIDSELIWTKHTIQSVAVGILWWNGVSTSIPQPCQMCQEDNLKFKNLLKEGNDVSKFDAYSYVSYEQQKQNRNIKTKDRRYCSKHCIWFAYFYAKRIAMLKNDS